jgi:transposase
MPAKYVRPYSKGQNNDFRDAEAIAEAVQRPTMKFVATKTADRELSRAQDHMVLLGRRSAEEKVPTFLISWRDGCYSI